MRAIENMDLTCQNSSLNAEYLLSQLNTARREINNLRQQVKGLRYILDKDVDNIKRILELQKHGEIHSQSKIISSEEAKPGTSKDQDILKLKPIGVISTWFPNKRATPRQPGICKKVPGKLTLYNSVFTNPDHALQGLQDFSHMWILFHFHRNDSTHMRAKVAPPRLNGIRTGVFSTRSPHRPCPIGLSLVKILKVENDTIYFEGVDMVNQTPVLDIKPYIPQYDSPLHIEKLSNRLRENDANVAEIFHNLEETQNSSNGRSVDSFNDDTNINNERVELDISRDEEIALRLQAEEFQAYPTLDGYDITRQSAQLMEDYANTAASLQIDENGADIHRGTYFVQDGSSDTRLDLDSSAEYGATSMAELQTDSVRDLNSRLHDVDINNSNSSDSARMERDNDDEINYTENQALRNSRLLDGADGPSTVCGTDIDLVSRHALHARVDNSPVRMGIREAPDGEEGFESQSLTPSRTLPDIHAATTVSSGPINTALESNFSEIRIPDWISQPRTATLSVIFNERALMQLNEILDDKIDEQKQAIENVLKEDPRSVYLRQRWGSQFYTFLIHDLHITCRFDDSRGVVTVFQVRHAGRTCDCGEPEWQCLGHSPLS
ncbi:tRNA (adenine(37)-N6)-methyltransferase-like [Linepithema humile]|uniref:tRNA (adenine(37)-N6)-methyltransferase-like n=1 Tax=Linepithema humile TaxID=83485 RepID=UPI0006235197|nr:PREDICTED: nef-associated protein 1-like [Linepithema humile]